MKELIVHVFGTYSPVMSQEIISYTVEDVTYSNVVNVVAPGAAGVDWTWVAGVFLFAIVLWSFFRLVGLLLAR